LRRRILLVALAVPAVVACDNTPRPQPTTLATQPHAADYYSKLLQQQLIDPDPVAIQQKLVCEAGRLSAALGPTEAALRMRGVGDSVVQTPAEQGNQKRVADRVGLFQYQMSGPVCDSLNAIAAREVPLPAGPAAAPVPPAKTP
jgi:hypothetical protein